MMSVNLWLVAAALVLVFVGGLFAMADAALASFSRSRADDLVAAGRRGAGRLRQLLDDPPIYLNTALLLVVVCETTACVLVTMALLDAFSERWQVVLVAAGAMVVASYIGIGVAPRTLGRQHAERIALVAAGPLRAVTRVFGPLPALLIRLGNALTPGKGFRDGPFATERELRELVDFAEAGSIIQAGERAMIHSVFELGDTLTREVMVPRTDVVFIERYKTLRQLLSLALRSGFSRIPVTGDGGLDEIIGIAYLKDVARRVYDNREAETSERVDSIARPALYVPDSKRADLLLRDMQSSRTHVAVVVDEYGGTAGLVTIEDVLEEIVGEITDEYDREEPRVQSLGDGSFRVPARLHVDDLGELFGIVLDDDEVDTVGGLMGKQLGRVPIPGSEVEVAGLRLVAESTSGRRNRVGTVLASRADGQQPAEMSAPEETA